MQARRVARAQLGPSTSPLTRLVSCCNVFLLSRRLSQHATIPTRGSVGAAGYDLSSAKDVLIPARGKGLCPTDLSIALPEGTYGRVAPRSGLAWKNSIDTMAGVIDADYRGNGRHRQRANALLMNGQQRVRVVLKIPDALCSHSLRSISSASRCVVLVRLPAAFLFFSRCDSVQSF